MVAAATARAEPDDQARAEARAHYRAGEVFHKAGRYDQAVAEYEAAYALAPLPILLYNIGQANRLRGEKEKAVEAYRRYLAADPDGKTAPDARRFMKALEEEIASAPRPAPPPAPPPPPPEPVPRPEPGPSRPPAEPPPPVTEAPVEAPKRSGRPLLIASAVTGVAGVAGLGLGVAFGLHARSLSDSVEKTYFPDDYKSGEAAERNMIIAVAAGGALLATSGVLLFLGLRAGASHGETAWVPVVGEDLTGVAVSGRF